MTQPHTAHCMTAQCFDSASMMCDHENYLATQYYLDQAKLFFSQFQPQDPSKRFANITQLEFDRGEFSQDYNRKLCESEEPREAGTQSKGQRLHDFFLTPCQIPTYNNALICEEHQCCSRSHQLFGNHSRQGTGSHIR